MSASFPCRDKFINALLKSASKLIPQFLNICCSKVSEKLRPEIHHSLFKLAPICFFVKRGMLRGTCLVWLGMVFTSTRTMSWSLRPGKVDTL